MTQLRALADDVRDDRDDRDDVLPRRSRWPLTATCAGALGLVAAALPHPGSTAATAVTSLSVLLLLVTAALWRRLVEPRTRTSTAAHVVPLALVASAAASAAGPPDATGRWLGLAAAAAALAWMGLRERTVSRLVSVASVLAVAGMVAAPALVAPSWLVVTGVALAYGRSTIAR